MTIAIIGVIPQVEGDLRAEFNRWLRGGRTDRFAGDDGRPLRLDEYPFWNQAMRDAALLEYNRIAGERDARRTAEEQRRGA